MWNWPYHPKFVTHIIIYVLFISGIFRRFHRSAQQQIDADSSAADQELSKEIGM